MGSGRLPAKVRGKEKKYEIQHLWDVHREILRRLSLGQKPKEIAAKLGITPQTVYNTRNSGIARLHMKHLQETMDGETIDMMNRIREYGPQALAIVVDEMHNRENSATVRTSLARDLLDRGGYQPPRKVDMRVLKGSLTPEDVERINERAILIRSESVSVSDEDEE